MDIKDNEQLKKIAVGIKNSDKQSFDELFKALYPRLKHFARGYTRNGEAASDIVQDAFVSLWNHRTNIEPEKPITSYIFMTVRNRALNYKRDYGNKITLYDDEKTEAFHSQNESKEHSHQIKNEASDLASQFKKWISELPSRQKEAFTLSRYDGFDHDEIADIMDISTNTVNNHIVAAIKYLRSQYQQHKNNDND